MTTAHDVVNIIDAKTGKEEIEKSHKELEIKLKELDRAELEGIALKLAYALSILRGGM